MTQRSCHSCFFTDYHAVFFVNVEKEVTSSGEISGNYMEEWNMLDPKDRLNLGLGVPRNTA